MNVIFLEILLYHVDLLRTVSMTSIPNKSRHHTKPALLVIASGYAVAIVCGLSVHVHARQSRLVTEGVYTASQASRGQAVYVQRCARCHGATLAGDVAPPLAGTVFTAAWERQSLADLMSKIQNTMPADDPGSITRQQAVDIVSYLLQAGRFRAGTTELGTDETLLRQMLWPVRTASTQPAMVAPMDRAASFPPTGNLAQVMRGILFPSSNLIFNVQNHEPSARKTMAVDKATQGAFSWVDWGADIYPGWELVDYAAIALAESAPLLMAPGRRCENGKPVPVERSDWIKYAQELADAGKAAYKASQSRHQDAVIEVTNQVAEACLHCHEAYRDKPGGRDTDMSNKAARCVP